MLATLARRGASSFTDLRRLLALTDGTLSVHLSKLEAAGIVEIIKGFEGKRPRTVVRMTRTGRKRFQCYVRELLEILPDPDASR